MVVAGLFGGKSEGRSTERPSKVSENELEPCLVTDIDLLQPLLRVADPEVMFGEEADVVFSLGRHVVEADASEQVVVLSQSEGGGEKITDIESG